MRKTLGLSVLAVFLASFWLTLPSGCANIIPPAGGPRDTIPPVLVDSDPADSTVNFNHRSINLTFDEYIDLRELQANLLLTPTFDRNPVIRIKGRSMNIRFQDSLEKNTTYVINFGNALTDVTENNVLKNFDYTFSTGPALDSLEISGRVLLAETGEVDSTLSVLLHRRTYDSAVVKDRPPYIVRVDSRGYFRFKHLPADSFSIFALGDAGYSKKYLTATQLFAFANQRVVAGKADSLKLYAYREKSQPATAPPGAGAGRTPNDRRLRFNTLTTEQQDLLTDYVFDFTVPLRSFDSARVSLSKDSVFTPVSFSTKLDSAKKQLRVITKWEEGAKYNLILDKEFATDTLGRQLLKTDTLFFTTKKLADYGAVSIKLKNIDLAARPVLQFVQNNNIVFSVPLKKAEFSEKVFIPGDYSLRILYDRNGNGIWDPGKYFGEKKQPELVFAIDQAITVKPAADNSFERGL